MTTNELALSSDLPTLTAEINAYKRVAGEAIFEIGKRLKSVRDAKIDAETADERRLAQQREDAGGWIRWLDDNFNFKRTQAHVYVSLAEKQNELGVRTSEHQGADALYLIATLPPEERTRGHTLSSGATKTPDEMTVRELREVKAALKAEREAREQAEARAQKAEDDYDVIRDTLDAVSTTYVDDGVYRIDNQTEVNGAALAFSDSVRDFLKEYAYLTSYCTELSTSSDEARIEYNSAIEALENFVIKFKRNLNVLTADAAVVIDITNYEESVKYV